MPGKKVVDLDGQQPRRRAILWECFGALSKINPTNIKEGGKGTCYVIVPQDKVEHVISTESKEKLKDERFVIHTPIAYNAMRTIIVRHIDKVVEDYSDNEIIENIRPTNPWAKVESVFKLMNSGRTLRVRFQTIEMAERAIRDGLIVIYQKIAPRHAEK